MVLQDHHPETDLPSWVQMALTEQKRPLLFFTDMKSCRECDRVSDDHSIQFTKTKGVSKPAHILNYAPFSSRQIWNAGTVAISKLRSWVMEHFTISSCTISARCVELNQWIWGLLVRYRMLKIVAVCVVVHPPLWITVLNLAPLDPQRVPFWYGYATCLDSWVLFFVSLFFSVNSCKVYCF